MRRIVLATMALVIAGCSSSAGSSSAGSSASTPLPDTATPDGTTAAPATTVLLAPSTTVSSNAAGLPDPTWTPGATDPRVTQANIATTICTSGYTTTVRPPESYTEKIKDEEDGDGGTVTYQGVTYPVHGFHLADHKIGDFELDHLVALEIGGAPADPKNLWMEGYERTGTLPHGFGSESKDKVENAAHRAVCDGQMTLATAQTGMATDWEKLGHTLGVSP